LKPVTEKGAMFKEGVIDGVIVRELKKHGDARGWLMELFRGDEVQEEYMPVMGYISVTNAGIARGPHEHADQADYFCFLGPSNFRIYLWDNRKDSATYMSRQVLVAGEDAPMAVIVPAGVVHAYKNIGSKEGLVVNCANRLYAGHGRKATVDEIRHEQDPGTIFRLD
jgi:dTDP-4-dehydrorhamnose 3,5-epimerase